MYCIRYFLRLKLQGVKLSAVQSQSSFFRKNFIYIECCTLTFIETVFFTILCFLNMLYTFLLLFLYFNLCVLM